MEELLESSLLKHYDIISFLLDKDWMTINRVAEETRIPAGRSAKTSVLLINILHRQKSKVANGMEFD